MSSFFQSHESDFPFNITVYVIINADKKFPYNRNHQEILHRIELCYVQNKFR